MASNGDARAIMDQCVQEVVTSGRTSLHTEDPLSKFEITASRSEELQSVLDLLHYADERIAHDNHKKYVLNRNGATSFVYLAESSPTRVNGISRTVEAQ